MIIISLYQFIASGCVLVCTCDRLSIYR